MIGVARRARLKRGSQLKGLLGALTLFEIGFQIVGAPRVDLAGAAQEGSKHPRDEVGNAAEDERIGRAALCEGGGSDEDHGCEQAEYEGQHDGKQAIEPCDQRQRHEIGGENRILIQPRAKQQPHCRCRADRRRRNQHTA